jgi:cobalt-zinc-cadmium efflux system protein
MPDDHGHSHGGGGRAEHAHGVSADADSGKLSITLGLILGFMAVEVAVGIIAHSLALLSDAGHMLTDAAAIGFSLLAARLSARPAKGAMTYDLKRVEILSAQANGVTLLVLSAFISYEAIRRLFNPPHVRAGLILAVALVGIAVNLAATWTLAKANRQSLNVEGSYRHILTDLYAFIGTAIAAGVILGTGFERADPIVSLLIAGLMIRSGSALVKASARIFLEAAPPWPRPGRNRPRDRPPARCRRGPRPPRLGSHLRIPSPLRPRPRQHRHRLPRHRLPRNPTSHGRAAPRPIPHPTHHPPSRPPRKRPTSHPTAPD